MESESLTKKLPARASRAFSKRCGKQIVCRHKAVETDDLDPWLQSSNGRKVLRDSCHLERSVIYHFSTHSRRE
jgi:hypothetical protein